MFKRKEKSKPQVTEQPVHFHRPAKPIHIKHRIAIASGKGGVGKSTVASNIAMGLAKRGLRVGLIDADIYGPSQPLMFGLQNQQADMNDQGKIVPLQAHGVQLISASMLLRQETAIVWRAPMATKLIRDFLGRVAWQGDLDYLLIDLPPGTGDIQITLAQHAKLDGAIIVTTPQQVAYQIAEKAMQMFAKVNVPIIGLIENMSGYICENCQHENHIFKQEGGDALAKKYETQILTRIPLDARIVESCDTGQSLLDEDSPAANAYWQAIDALPERLQNADADRYQPQAVDFHPQALHLRWADGTEKTLSAYALRSTCSCALCIDELTGKLLLQPEQIAKNIELLGIDRVGRYGLKIRFSDGHDTGIFTFKKLQHLDDCTVQAETVVDNTPAEPLSMAAVKHILDKDLNPSVAAHGGKIELVAVEGQIVKVRMQGGCQGCSQANVTLKQGVFQVLKKHFPLLENVVDVTDHSMGNNPYY